VLELESFLLVDLFGFGYREFVISHGGEGIASILGGKVKEARKQPGAAVWHGARAFATLAGWRE
jgi:hypothetical protein